ncbi:MAG: hypothetical protein KGL39_26175 [Patescibacteria group bacterium]|nr:hypothetical protein [Patescibacteria group bacterium]
MPTLPSGWTSIATGTVGTTGTTGAYRIGCNISSSGSDTTSGTWTNATNVVGASYAGTEGGTTANCNTTGIGNKAANSAQTSTTASFTGITVQNSANWVTGWLGDSGASLCTPSNLTAITSTGDVRGLDTNATVSSFTTSTCTVTSSTWMTYVAEVKAALAKTASVADSPLTGDGASGMGAHLMESSDSTPFSSSYLKSAGMSRADSSVLSLTDVGLRYGAHFATSSDPPIPGVAPMTWNGGVMTWNGGAMLWYFQGTAITPSDLPQGFHAAFSSTIEYNRVSESLSRVGAIHGVASEISLFSSGGGGQGAHFAAPSDSALAADTPSRLAALRQAASEALLSHDSSTAYRVILAYGSEVLAVYQSPSGLAAHLASAMDYSLALQFGTGLAGHFLSVSDGVMGSYATASIGAHFSTTKDVALSSSLSTGYAAHLASTLDYSLALQSSAGLAGHFLSVSDGAIGSYATASIGAHFSTVRDASLSSSLGAGYAAHLALSLENLPAGQVIAFKAGRLAGYIEALAFSSAIANSAGRHAAAREVLGLYEFNRGARVFIRSHYELVLSSDRLIPLRFDFTFKYPALCLEASCLYYPLRQALSPYVEPIKDFIYPTIPWLTYPSILRLFEYVP